jgi:hypothetical protein
MIASITAGAKNPLEKLWRMPRNAKKLQFFFTD